jgi:hypothetical protein
MSELKPKSTRDVEKVAPKWLVFVSKAADDGPLLRMMVLNPINGAMCPLINRPVEPDARDRSPSSGD